MGLMDSIKGQFIDVIELVDDDSQSVVKKLIENMLTIMK